ncbi:MAG: hypothetical protein AAF598_12820 [Bacteroidota bacterium]
MQTKDDLHYIQTKAVLRGERQLDSLKQQLIHWISNRFEIDVINIEYDKIAQGTRDRINVIVRKRADAEKMDHRGPDYFGYDQAYQQEILDAFQRIYAGANFIDFSGELKPWVMFSVFNDIALSEANTAISLQELTTITEEYAALGIWQIIQFFGATVVFHFKTDQVEHLDQAKAESLRKRLLQAIKAHDEFDLIEEATFTLNFDSKEHLDQKFDGNMLNYFR